MLCLKCKKEVPIKEALVYGGWCEDCAMHRHGTHKYTSLQDLPDTSERLLEHNGLSMTVNEWARELGMTHQALRGRIKKWGLEAALSTPRGSKPAEELRCPQHEA